MSQFDKQQGQLTTEQVTLVQYHKIFHTSPSLSYLYNMHMQRNNIT